MIYEPIKLPHEKAYDAVNGWLTYGMSALISEEYYQLRFGRNRSSSPEKVETSKDGSLVKVLFHADIKLAKGKNEHPEDKSYKITFYPDEIRFFLKGEGYTANIDNMQHPKSASFTVINEGEPSLEGYINEMEEYIGKDREKYHKQDISITPRGQPDKQHPHYSYELTVKERQKNGK